MSTAVIVGGGPNGLTAAILLAQQGVHVTVLEAADSVGGGVRSGAATGPGLIHDYCSAIHPMAVGSPVLAGLDLEKHGLQWLWPEVDCAHPSMTVRAACFIAMSPQLPMAWDATGAGGGRYSNGRHATLIY